MAYPYRYFRLAWQVILENFDLDNPVFKRHIEGPEGIKINSQKEKIIVYAKYPEGDISFADETEEDWTKKVFRVNGEEYHYQVKGYYQIKLEKEKIGIIIELAANLKPKENSDFRYAQEKLNRFAHKYDKTGDQLKISTGEIGIPYGSLVNLLNFAIELLRNKETKSTRDTVDEKILHFIIQELPENTGSETGKSDFKRISGIQVKFWEHKEPLNRFANRKFLCYQRTDGCKDAEANFGVASSAIYIGQADNEACTITMHCNFNIENGDPEKFKYEGLLAYDESINYLVAELKRQGTETSPASFAYFFIRLPTNAGKVNNELYIGYHVYYSITVKRVIVKTVFIQNFGSNTKAEDRLPFTEDELNEYVFDLNPFSKIDNPSGKEQSDEIKKDDNKKDERFGRISLLIRRFLAERNLNRLTMPEQEIGMLVGAENSLSAWMAYQKRATEDKILEAVGNYAYHVFYYYGPTSTTPLEAKQLFSSMRRDDLTLTYDNYMLDCNAAFVHRKMDRYIGYAKRQQSTISIIMDSIVSKHKTSSADIVHLTFSIPLDEKLFKEEYKGKDDFEGIISGLNDNGNTPISFVCLVKKANKKTIEAFEKDGEKSPLGRQLLNFFRKHQGQLQISVKPNPIPSINELQTLIQTIGYVGQYDFKAKTFIIKNVETDEIIKTWPDQKDINQAVQTGEQTMRDLLDGNPPKAEQ